MQDNPAAQSADHCQANEATRQPAGLRDLIVVEGLERMAFYGMQSLLVLYMAKALLPRESFEGIHFLPELERAFGTTSVSALSSAIFGLFAGLLYAAPLVGGVISDRLLGCRRSIILGGLFMAAGYFLLAWDYAFLPGLACIIVGSGLFKGNITSQVGALYRDGDVRRSDGYQLFILSASIGGIAAPIVIGSIGENVSWQLGFAAAGLTMAVGVATYVGGLARLPAAPSPGHTTLPSHAVTPHASKRGPVIRIMILASILSVLLVPNFQILNAYMLWGDTAFDLAPAGWRIPTSWLIMLDAVVSIVAISVSLRFWTWRRQFHEEPDDLAKMLIGCSLVVGGMLILTLAAAMVPPGGKITLVVPLLFQLINAFGYAQIVPVALSAFSRLAPPGLESTSMGLFYFSFSGASMLTGWIGSHYAPQEVVLFWVFHAALAAVGGFALAILRWRTAITA